MINQKMFAFSLMLMVFGGVAQASTPAQITLPVKHVYVPKGFDDNDNTEIVVTGNLPNLCYYGPSATAEVKDGKINIEVTAFESKADTCEMMVVPFMLTVRVGVIPAGTYAIVINHSDAPQALATMVISKALTDQVDDHIYANVDSVERVDGSRVVKLHGYNPSDCYTLDHIQSVSNGLDTIAVLPIMKKVHSVCPMKMVPFEMSYTVPQTLNVDELLIHVRSMKGASVNYLFLENLTSR